MRKPELIAPMIKILNEVMPQVLKDAYNVNWGQSLARELGKSLSKYENATASDKYDDLEIQAGRYLYDLMHAVVDDGHHSQESVSEFANLIERVNDPKIKQALLRIATYEFGGAAYTNLSELEKKLLTNLAVGPQSTIHDKIYTMQSLYDTRIMESALTQMRKDLQSAFDGKYPDMEKINAVKNSAKELLNVDNSYAKAGYDTKIKEEFLDEKAIFAKYDRHNDKLGQPEYMLQDVIPGTEKDIKYDFSDVEKLDLQYSDLSKKDIKHDFSGAEKLDLQYSDLNKAETQKQSEPQQATIIEMQQEQQIADLKKQIADMQKQMDDLRKENDNLQRKNQESITKVEKFQHVSEELQQELNAKNKENKELQTEKDQLNNMGKGELFKRFLFGNGKGNE